LLQECDLHTIIRLPKTVFAPYTTVATNILFFTKGKPTDDIWFYEHQLPDGVKAYNKTKPIKIEEFDSIKSWWVNREESSQSWPVTIDDVIKRNYNLDFSNPNKVDIIHDSPQNIRAIHNSLLETCNELREEIENVLNVALGREDWSILTGNVRNLKKVKLLILTLALKGSLSSLEVNDESIGDLISRVKIQIQDDFAMSEERFSIPSHWKWVPLGSISDHQLGKMLNTAKMRGEKRYYLRSVNIRQDGSIDLSDVKEMLIPENELEKYSVRKNDLFVNEGGDVGRNAIFKIEPKEPLAFQNQLHRLRPMCGVRPEYVQMVLQQAKESNVIAEMSSGVTIQHFPANAIRRFAVPLPPIAEQDRIVERVEELFDLCNKLQANLTFSSEVSDAFADSIVAGVAKQ
jgi:type I restriction enzyme M protein